MSWKMAEKPKTVKVTRALVDEFFNMTPAPGDRQLKDVRASRIRHLLMTGQYRTGEFASAHCLETGETYRVNGKHTSAVLASLNGDMPKEVWVIVERFVCDTLDDVARLYATFDARDSLRTTGDINRSFAGGHEELAHISSRIIYACATGLSYEKWEDGYTRVRPEDRAALLIENCAFVTWYHSLVPSWNQSVAHVCRGAVVAAMVRTYFKSQRAATEFWELVRDGSGSNHKSADRILNKFLLTHAVSRGTLTTKQDSSRRAMYVKCLHAWNAWRKSVPTDLKYYPKAETPKAG